MNLNLAIDTSQFKPFDYSLALLTLKDYNTTLQRYDEYLNKIAEEKGKYIIPDTPENLEYRNIMSKYDADYKAAAEDFYKGMNSENTRRILDIRRRFAKEVDPINKAIEAYNKALDKLIALGPDAIVSNRNRTIKDYYGGLNPGIDYRSAKQVEADSMKYFSGINNALTLDPDFSRKILGDYYYLQTQKGGLDSGAALQAALVEYNNRTNGQHSEAVQNLLGHMQNVMNSLAVDNFSEDAKRQVWNKVASGLIDSLQAPKYERVVNKGQETPSERASRELGEENKWLLMLQRIAAMEDKGYIPTGYDDKGYPTGFKYNPEEAKKRAANRRKPESNVPKESYIIFENRKWHVEKVGDVGSTYRVYDIDTKEEALGNLRQRIINYYTSKDSGLKLVNVDGSADGNGGDNNNDDKKPGVYNPEVLKLLDKDNLSKISKDSLNTRLGLLGTSVPDSIKKKIKNEWAKIHSR